MRANPIRSLTLLAAMTIVALVSMPSAAQDFPTRPVRFIVPYAAGGSGDLLARLLGNKLAAIWGQQVVVDNRAGGGGLIGTEFAARSDPDGYALYLATDGPLTVAASLYKRVPYDWKRDFALAREKPGELNYASIGIGSAPHLGAELFKSVAKVDVTHVPYRGSSAHAISALLAGDVAMFLVGTSTAVSHIQSGALRGLAVTAGKRVDGLPDVPTFAEAGLPGVDVSLWFAVLAPSGTPAPIVKKLNADIAQVVADPDFRQALAVRGFDAVSSSPEELAQFLAKDYVKFRDLIQKLGLQVE